MHEIYLELEGSKFENKSESNDDYDEEMRLVEIYFLAFQLWKMIRVA